MKKVILQSDILEHIAEMHQQIKNTHDRSEEYKGGFTEALNQLSFYLYRYNSMTNIKKRRS